MNGTVGRNIEIFAPFNEAIELTKRILFQPFDLGKWCVIGFAAFLSHLAGGGGGGGFNFNSWKNQNWRWNYQSTTHDAIQSATGAPGWVFPLIAFGGLVVLALLIVLLWVGSRGRFIFVDCIVRNRGAIVEPWHEFRKEGNSYFCFLLIAITCVVIIIGLAGLPLWLPLVLHGNPPEGPGMVIGLIFLFGIIFVIAVIMGLIGNFMLPIMYRRRCGAVQALSAAIGMVMEHTGPVILYLLFSWVLAIAVALIACLTTCLTCCITAIPYVGTVILLPLFVFMVGYMLLFVRQFGPDYDAWANVAVVEATAAAPAIEPPPVAPAPPANEPPPPTDEPPQPPVQT